MFGPRYLRKNVIYATARFCTVVFFLAGACWVLSGCSDHLRQPTAAELARFKMVEPSGPSVDTTQIGLAKPPRGPYRVVPGDVLGVEMPATVAPQTDDTNASLRGATQTYTCRVRDDGTITLPIIGRLAVAGKSLSEIESVIVSAYYPKYVKVIIPVYVTVVEYKTYRVSIVGAVEEPGIYRLRHDQMSIVGLLMEAGNIVDQGAALIEITRTRPEDQDVVASRTSAHSSAQEAGASSDLIRAVFEQDGPLRTTGWISLERRNAPRIRQWLDLGNEAQRQAFLQAAVGDTNESPVRDMEAKLLQLATYLEPDSLQEGGQVGFTNVNWQAFGHGQFAVSLSAAGQTTEIYGQTPTAPTDREPSMCFPLPVRGLNMPFADVALQEGDSVSVQPPYEQSVAVVGLVNRPGNMPYPPNTRLRLIEAIAFAGGLDLVADPRFVTVYRLQADGTVKGVTLQLVNPKKKQQLTQDLTLALRPGDVVSVESTPRTRAKVFFDRVFRVTLGLYVSPDIFWRNNG